jgi:predicted ATPase
MQKKEKRGAVGAVDLVEHICGAHLSRHLSEGLQTLMFNSHSFIAPSLARALAKSFEITFDETNADVNMT